MMTRKRQEQEAKRIRAVLAPLFTAARWTNGGYCLVNKMAVHREGYRVVVPKKSYAYVIVRFEDTPGIPYSMEGLHKWEHDRRIKAHLVRYQRALGNVGIGAELVQPEGHPPELRCPVAVAAPAEE
jgi:hypothetical protein